jgi:hypothetical protein
MNGLPDSLRIGFEKRKIIATTIRSQIERSTWLV